MLGIPNLGTQVCARGIAWHHLPIVDVEPPDAGFEAATDAQLRYLLDLPHRRARPRKRRDERWTGSNA
jgi:hypothetical protein